MIRMSKGVSSREDTSLHLLLGRTISYNRAISCLLYAKSTPRTVSTVSRYADPALQVDDDCAVWVE